MSRANTQLPKGPSLSNAETRKWISDDGEPRDALRAGLGRQSARSAVAGSTRSAFNAGQATANATTAT